MRIVIDTNVVASAIFFGGRPKWSGRDGSSRSAYSF